MKYWVFIDGRQQGPFTFEQLYDLPVDKNTKVWFEGLPRWCTMGEIDEFNPLFPESEPQATAETVLIEEETIVADNSGNVFVAEGPVVAAAVAPVAPEPAPATYLGWTIFLVICCCSPLSIAALVSSIFTSSYYSKGEIAKARKASEITAWLVMISFALGMLPWIFLSCIF